MCESNHVALTLRRSPDQSNQCRKPDSHKYTGTWTENRKDKNRFQPMKIAVNLKATDGKVVDVAFQWVEGEFKLAGLLGLEWELTPILVGVK